MNEVESPAVTAAPLTEVERNNFTYYRHRVKSGLDAFVRVGESLIEIRDGKLYREEFGTFEDYCRTELNCTARRARQLMTAAEVVNTLPGELGTIVPNEGVAREIAKIEPTQRAAVVRKVVAGKRPGSSITAKCVKNAAVMPAPQTEEECEQQLEAARMAWKDEVKKIITLLITKAPMYGDGTADVVLKIANEVRNECVGPAGAGAPLTTPV